MNSLRRLFAALALCAAADAHAVPRPQADRLDAVPLHALPEGTLRQQIDRLIADPRARLQFALSRELEQGLEAGSWDVADDGRARWRLRLFSPAAQTLNLEFSRFELPASAQLWLYDAAGRVVQGPYTAQDRSPEGRLWTALVPGDTAVIELRVAPQDKKRVSLRLARLNHGFRGFETAAGVVPKSGPCNIDVVCPQGSEWRDEIRSAARITIGGIILCSGQLVNNTRQDNDPLFLTAHHCGIGESLATRASSVVVYWNYQTSSCGGTPDGSLSQTQTGSTLLARDENSDYALVRLASRPPAAYGVHYAGWYAGSRAAACGASIHHPNGDQKRISLFTSTVTRADDVCLDEDDDCTRRVDTWRVNWSEGVTEPGSSGGGLWNQNHRLVGVLSGGAASCEQPNEPDYYGRLELAWNAGLRAQLDPAGTGAVGLGGRDPAEGPAPLETSDTTGTQCSTTSEAGAGEGDDGGGAPGPVLLLVLAGAAALRRRAT